MVEQVLFTWSGGKDSSLALYEILKSGEYTIKALITTVTEGYNRISMHGVRAELLDKQAESLGIPLEKVFISKNASNDEYENKMRYLLSHHKNQGISSVVIGDIFLEDLRKYREENLAKIGMQGIFPLWMQDTKKLALRFIDLGFRSIITCIDSKVLDKSFAGCSYDIQFLSELPPDVDPCGENGEFHTFVYDGPIFHKIISFTKGDIVFRDNRFYFCDLLPNLL